MPGEATTVHPAAPGRGARAACVRAIISISLNPLLFRAIDPVEGWIRSRPRLAALLQRSTVGLGKEAEHPTARGDLRGHAVLCGYGRVGSLVARTLDRRGLRYVVVDQDRRRVEALRRRGIAALYGDAANPALLAHAGLEGARVLVIAFSDPPSTRHVVENARRAHPRLSIVARTQGEEEWLYLRDHGVDEVVRGEHEVAVEMSRFTLHRFGIGGAELQALVQGLRQRSPGHEAGAEGESLRGPLEVR